MLIVVVRQKKRDYILAKLPDDNIAGATELATGAVVNNKRYNKAFIYIQHNGSKPLKVKTISISWTSKMKSK